MVDMKYFFLFFTALLLSGYASEPYSGAGTSSNLLLRFGPSVRVTGMAEAFTGMADDENALFYNPAGLVNIKSGMATLNHTEWFSDIRIENIVLGYNPKGDLGLGIGFTHLYMPGIEGKDLYGRPTGEFTVSSSIFNLGFSYKFHPGVFGGIGIKYFNDKLADYSASGLALDLGGYFDTSVPGLSAGFAVQNFGGEIQYDQEKQKIPLTYRVGVAYDIYQYHLLLCMDLVKSSDTGGGVNFGLEYTIFDIIYLRLGNKFSSVKPFEPAFGTGFKIQDKYFFNYTLYHHSELGMTHRIGFTFKLPERRKNYFPSAYPSLEQEVLRPPSNLSVRINEDRLLLSWYSVAGAQYNVYARYAEGGGWKKLNENPLIATAMSFKKPIITGEYHFRVSSIIDGKESTFSEEVKIDVK
jgi:hypothetical protein